MCIYEKVVYLHSVSIPTYAKAIRTDPTQAQWPWPKAAPKGPFSLSCIGLYCASCVIEGRSGDGLLNCLDHRQFIKLSVVSDVNVLQQT